MPRTDFNIKILVAPLDWGLGHATRCIPLINHLISLGCTVLLAVGGPQKKLLQIEFPNIIIEDLDGYNITYSKKKYLFSLKILLQLPKIFFAIAKEHRWLKDMVKKHKIDAVISDNRYGLWHPTLPVVFITHQLNIKTPYDIAESLLRKVHYKLINRFYCCWVPDVAGEPNAAGALSHPKILPAIPVSYLGLLSRLDHHQVEEEYDTIIVLSGPEPQRSVLERMILNKIDEIKGKLLLVRGLPGDSSFIPSRDNVQIINHLSAKELGIAIQKSKFVISRSGYTSIMDILKLNKKSILIPTPGQSEQEYLANHMHQQGWSLTISQRDFKLKEALDIAEKFPYKEAGINMEIYKEVVNDFIAALPTV